MSKKQRKSSRFRCRHRISARTPKGPRVVSITTDMGGYLGQGTINHSNRYGGLLRPRIPKCRKPGGYGTMLYANGNNKRRAHGGSAVMTALYDAACQRAAGEQQTAQERPPHPKKTLRRALRDALRIRR